MSSTKAKKWRKPFDKINIYGIKNKNLFCQQTKKVMINKFTNKKSRHIIVEINRL